MRKICCIIIMIILFLCSCANRQELPPREIQSQQFLTHEKILDNIAKETKIRGENINESYIWLQYANIDEDQDLELLLSYRYEIHKGFFFIYDYLNGCYTKVFSRPWAVEKMSMREIVNAEGNDKIHSLMFNILYMLKGKVSILWTGIQDRYDYSKLTSGTEIHGQYYIDTNGVLNYFYKTDQTNQNGIPIKTEYKNERYIWDIKKNAFLLK